MHAAQEPKITFAHLKVAVEGCVIKYVSNTQVEHVGVQCPDCLLSETCTATLDHRGGTTLPCGLSVSSSMFGHVTPLPCVCVWFHQFR